QGHDHELVGGVGFEFRELLGERGPRRLIEDVGVVHHAAAECGEVERESRDDGEQKKNEAQESVSRARQKHPSPPPSLPRKRERGHMRRICHKHLSRPHVVLLLYTSFLSQCEVVSIKQGSCRFPERPSTQRSACARKTYVSLRCSAGSR